MRTAWKILWMGIAAIVALGVLLFALAFAVNSSDEPLGAEARALRAPPANPLPDEQNIYLALSGANAPPGQSPTRVGAGRVAAWNRQLAAATDDPVPPVRPMPDDPGALEFKGKVPVCPGLDEACWREAPRHASELAALLVDNREQVARYRALWSMAGYFDTARPDLMLAGAAPFPAFGGEARRLAMADIVLRLQAASLPGRRAALEDLLSDLGLWRRVLVGQGNLLSSMLALGRLQLDEQLLAIVIADPGVPIERISGVEPAPLFAEADWHIGNAFAYEFRGSVSLWERFRNPKFIDWVQPEEESALRGWWRRRTNRLANHFMQANATENLWAGMYGRMIDLGNSPPVQVLPRQERVRQWSEDQMVRGRWRMIYNPMGRTLLYIAVPAFRDYPLRSWDVAAQQRMVRLAWEIRRLHVPADSVAALMKAHPEWSTHPVDGASFTWDEAARTLSMQPLSKSRTVGHFSIPVWQPAH